MTVFEEISSGDTFVCLQESSLELRDEIGKKIKVIVPGNYRVTLSRVQEGICRSAVFHALLEGDQVSQEFFYPLGLFLHYFAKIEK